MDLQVRFPEESLTAIVQETGEGTCACPAEVCSLILAARRLFEMQLECVLNSEDGPLRDSHGAIAYYARLVHQQLEERLDQVMSIEGWNPLTLEIPPGIRRLRGLGTGG